MFEAEEERATKLRSGQLGQFRKRPPLANVPYVKSGALLLFKASAVATVEIPSCVQHTAHNSHTTVSLQHTTHSTNCSTQLYHNYFVKDQKQSCLFLEHLKVQSALVRSSFKAKEFQFNISTTITALVKKEVNILKNPAIYLARMTDYYFSAL